MIKTGQKNIRHLTLPELEQYFETLGEKKFRVKQVWEWLWQKGAQSFADMTNLSKELRQKLGEHFTLPALTIDATQNTSIFSNRSSYSIYYINIIHMIPAFELLSSSLVSLTFTFCNSIQQILL